VGVGVGVSVAVIVGVGVAVAVIAGVGDSVGVSIGDCKGVGTAFADAALHAVKSNASRVKTLKSVIDFFVNMSVPPKRITAIPYSGLREQ
jgi:hypothetical protein